jgi:hypothetical protein
VTEDGTSVRNVCAAILSSADVDADARGLFGPRLCTVSLMSVSSWFLSRKNATPPATGPARFSQ